MTIAAGFRCIDGVVLAADTRVEEAFVQHDVKKILTCAELSQSDAYMAGSGDFGALQNLADIMIDQEVFREADGSSIRSMKKALRRFLFSDIYRNLLTQETSADGGISFDAVIALRARNGQTDLLCLKRHHLYSVDEYQCLGSGYDTGMFFTKWLYTSGVSVKEFAQLAFQIVRSAKDHNVGVGGGTQVVVLTNTTPDQSRTELKLIFDRSFLWGVHDLLRPLVYGVVDEKVSDDIFQRYLTRLVERLCEARTQNIRYREAATPPGEGPEPPESSTHELTDQQPSLE
jgi:20S proteasome alpha/beta subunit